jgi:hypothetical protein
MARAFESFVGLLEPKYRMNILLALGILLLGAGLGALLLWIQQAAMRRQFRKELETQIYQPLFSGRRHGRLHRRARGV